MRRGSPGGQGGEGSLGRRNSTNKDMEARRRANCSGNSKELLHCWIQQVHGQRLSWRGGGQQQATAQRDTECRAKQFRQYSQSSRAIQVPVQIPILPGGASGVLSHSSQGFTLVLPKESSASVAFFQQYDRHRNLLKICLSLHRVPNSRLFTVEGIFKIHAGQWLPFFLISVRGSLAMCGRHRSQRDLDSNTGPATCQPVRP